MPPVLFENRVRFAETDLQGVVFYGTFFTYQDETVNEFFRRVGHPYSSLPESGWTTHVVSADLNFEAPARFEDVIQNTLRIDAIGTSSITAEYGASRRSDDTQLASGTVTHVSVDDEAGNSIRVPDSFREAVVEFQEVPPDPV